jgi:hypothetical protein
MTQATPAASQPRSLDGSLADLIEELSAKIEAGDAVDLPAYLEAHPAHAAELRRLVPALQLLADFSRSGSQRAACMTRPTRECTCSFWCRWVM